MEIQNETIMITDETIISFYNEIITPTLGILINN